MELAEERAAFVALALTPGIGAVRLAALLQHCHTAHGALSAPFAFLCTVPGIGRAAASAIHATSPESGLLVLTTIEEMGGLAILPGDPFYPEPLRHIPDAPTLLFALGELSLLSRPAAAIVGSRDHSEYGAGVCREVSAAAARAGVVVVSGMARGLDAIAHAAALDAGGGTIGVLGNGLGVIYPAANRALYERVAAEGLLLTEFPPGERPGVGSFPRRNRLISALAQVTVVIEAAEGSGTLITVGTALAQGKDVMAVPGLITSTTSIGTNRLIRDGAEPLLSPDDLLRHFPALAEPRSGEPARTALLAPPPRAAKPILAPPTAPSPLPIPDDLPQAVRRVADVLVRGPSDVDRLTNELGLPVAEVLAALSTLELRGLAGQEAGFLVWGVERSGTCAKLS